MVKGHGKGKKNSKFENPCWYNHCHHNCDKRRILWKQGRHKTNKAVRFIDHTLQGGHTSCDPDTHDNLMGGTLGLPLSAAS